MRACKAKGFDAVEPDEMTGWSNDTGFRLTYADQIRYNRAVARWAHDLHLSVGMKGDLEQAHDLAPYFDWNLTEECYQYRECTRVWNQGPGADGRVHAGSRASPGCTRRCGSRSTSGSPRAGGAASARTPGAGTSTPRATAWDFRTTVVGCRAAPPHPTGGEVAAAATAPTPLDRFHPIQDLWRDPPCSV